MPRGFFFSAFSTFEFMEEYAKTSRIPELDLVRVIAMLLVVTYHFGMEYRANGFDVANFLCVTVNYDFGNVAVTLFLLLSGALLFRKYGDSSVGSLKKFYAVRARAIYPPFWIMNLYVVFSLVRHQVSDGSPFFAGNPLKLLLTVTGFDGYVRMFGFENYYFCGDWFIGGIVLLYLLFPLLVWTYKKCRMLLLAVLAVGYGLQYLLVTLVHSSLDFRTVFSILPFTLMLKFVLGFFVMEYLHLLRKKCVAVLSLILVLVLSLVNLPGILNLDFFGTLCGVCLFPVILSAGSVLLKKKFFQKGFSRLAPMAYCVFLIQHVAINWSLLGLGKMFARMGWNVNAWNGFALLAMTLAIIFIAAWCLKLASDKLTSRWPFSILVKK